ncbi:SURF1 family protein [Massilia sp. S19_KUP03_FR1]|uniref:SURF1 family protein n=1 Tax=Massilia sp. S19_KUP03_FR1 TaxID=3025503 RepID=UPI002FCD0430
MRLRFRFRLIPCIATILVVVLGIALGNWQERRAAQKTGLQVQLTERARQAPLVLTGGTSDVPQEFRRVSVRGQFVPGFAVFLDNRPYQSRAGYYLVMPFKIEGADQYVLVARGWLPRAAGAVGQLPLYQTPAGAITLEGVMRLDLGHVMQLGTAPPLTPNAMVQNVSVADVARASNLPLLPFFIQQTRPQAARDTLVRDWPSPATGVDKHRGYAFQWYALATMAVLFFVFTGFRRDPNHKLNPSPE